LYGGADASSVTADTWEWNSYRRSWQRLSVEGPGPRTFPAFAYHDRAHHAVLFGGNRVLFGKPDDTNTFLSDTWIWRRGRWSHIDVPGPAPRAEAAVAYDQHRARVVLFGGYYRGPSGTVRLGDTWEWDGTRWIQMAGDGPSPRNGAAMAYDARRQRVVLFGGSGASRETWEWDGSRWLQRDAGDVEGRFNPAMIFDPASRLVPHERRLEHPQPLRSGYGDASVPDAVSRSDRGDYRCPVLPGVRLLSDRGEPRPAARSALHAGRPVAR
jgi:hypothetical protein